MPHFADKSSILSRVIHLEARSYLEEAIKCHEVEAYRASVTMMCCAVFYDVRLKAYGLASYDPWFDRFSKHVEHMREKQDSFESNVMEKVRSSRLFKEEQKSYLDRIWKSRNDAAHPTKVTVSEHLSEDFIRTGVDLFLADKALLGDPGVDVILEQLENVDMFPHEFSTRDVSVARDLLQDVLIGGAYFKLAEKIVSKLKSEPDARFQQNAIRFLKAMALMQTPDSISAITTALIQRRTPEAAETWHLEIIALSPEMLKAAGSASKNGLDVSLAAMCRSFDDSDPSHIRKMQDLLEQVMSKIDAVRLHADFPSFLDALLSFVWCQPAVVNCLVAGGGMRVFASYELHKRLAEPVDAGRFVRYLKYRGFENQLADALSDDEAFTILAQIACAAVNRDPDCNRILDADFADLPSLRAKAIKLAIENPDEAENILGSYNGHWDLAMMKEALDVGAAMDA
ncbi:hypothetical protein GGE45_002578 [Rhizobium aethiopicum]|uniref:Uncharacterized protein n=1 Tax=Rhizobium aethiopicum TaxID=1138170 RepID=A0A7W6MC60_9HYPH|nr:hypothetical protein [Rhizobium aethiopicum]MBB4190013.1 hypothetical protein [Rhizobium aethiopicum]MBB4580248.1 hypothetical protein [Rhizobium aethiopicum]